MMAIRNGDELISRSDASGWFYPGSVVKLPTNVGIFGRTASEEEIDRSYSKKLFEELKKYNSLVKSPTPMGGECNSTPSVIERFRDLTATPDDKLMKELGLENPVGNPTRLGLDLLLEFLYKEHRPRLVEIARKLKEEQDAKKKST